MPRYGPDEALEATRKAVETLEERMQRLQELRTFDRVEQAYFAACGAFSNAWTYVDDIAKQDPAIVARFLKWQQQLINRLQRWHTKNTSRDKTVELYLDNLSMQQLVLQLLLAGRQSIAHLMTMNPAGVNGEQGHRSEMQG